MITVKEIEDSFSKTLKEINESNDPEKVILEAMVQNELILMKLERAPSYKEE